MYGFLVESVSKKKLTNDIFAFLGKLFEYWRLLIGCSSESNNQSEVSKIWKGHQNGKDYDMIYLDEFLVYSRNNRQKSNYLNPFESGAKIVISQFFHLDCMHLWILWSISLLGHKSFVFGWQKKFFLFWNRPGLKEKIERQKGVVNIPSCDELCETQHNLSRYKIEKHLRIEFLHWI